MDAIPTLESPEATSTTTSSSASTPAIAIPKNLTNRALAFRLCRLVGHAGVSEREFSQRCGLSGAHVGLLIDRLSASEQADVQRRTLVSIADACGVTLDWLIAGRGDEPVEAHVRRCIARSDL